MPIVIIGGGLTGLAAAWQLEQLGAAYTLIEVKPRLGGSIVTRSEGGFVLDGGPFLFEKYGPWPFLDALGLPDALEPAGRYRDGELVYFRAGTQRLVDALAGRLTRPVVTRMAVSSVGQRPGGFDVCLENGLMLEASGVVAAVPARYAARILRAVAPGAAAYLDAYDYDAVARVSLGFRAEDVAGGLARPADERIRFLEGYTFAPRVPPGCALVRAGVRIDPALGDAALPGALDLVRGLIPAQPLVAWATYWPEDFPRTRALPEHAAAMARIEAELPPGLVLAGSDYRAKHLNEQIEGGAAAARRVYERTAAR